MVYPFSIFYFLFFAMLGAIVGSFLNVLILRMGTGRGVGGRSSCLSCSKTLGFTELVPIFSFIIQGGRCRSCKSVISIQYIIVEVLTALSFTLIAWKTFDFRLSTFDSISLFSFFTFLFSCGVAAVLIAIVAYDMKHYVIPDILVLALFILAVLRIAYLFTQDGPVLVQIVSALFLAGFLFLLWLLSRGRWIGLGDAKLLFPLALLLPWSENLTAVIVSFWTGAIVGLALILIGKLGVGKRYQLKSELPFAPFLVLGTAIAYFIHIPLLQF